MTALVVCFIKAYVDTTVTDTLALMLVSRDVSHHTMTKV